jgi:hypothetical protein
MNWFTDWRLHQFLSRNSKEEVYHFSEGYNTSFLADIHLKNRTIKLHLRFRWHGIYAWWDGKNYRLKVENTKSCQKTSLLLLSCVLIVFTVVPLHFYLLQFQGGLSNKQEEIGELLHLFERLILTLNIVFICITNLFYISVEERRTK